MKRTLTPLAATICVVALASAAGASSSAQKIQLRSTDKGKILVDKAGDTLFVFTHDKRNKDTCMHISMCSGTWPSLTTKGKPTAGKGVKARLLGTITLAHGVKQVTYDGRPLYTYCCGAGPGDTLYLNADQFGGRWDGINAAGKLVK